jgi:conjugative relaxase-like TrwC/TraI family protein
VLTVAKISRSSAAGYGDYLEGKARQPELGDYYLKDGERTEAPGRWAQGADRVGLNPAQPVTGGELRALMAVRRPDSGEELRRVGGSGAAVAALDATFSAPKSVSAVWALAGPELRSEIERAHEAAIDRALAYASRQVPMLRRRVGRDTVVHEKATGVVATSWRHTTARAVAGQAPDPQLHSHVLLHAAVRRDGRLVAIDSRAWLVHQRELGAAYRTELARELSRLGFQIRRGTGRSGRYFELDGVPQGLLDRWSNRRQQVQAAIRERLTDQQQTLERMIARGGPDASEAAEQLEVLHRYEQISPKEERMMAIATRTAKAPVTVEDLDRAWQRTGIGLGISRERVALLRHLPRSLEAASASEVLEGLTEFDATFPARDARAVALERSAGAPIDAALDQLRALRASDDILLLADGTGTTREHRGRERTAVAIIRRLAAARIDPIPSEMAARETARLDRELAKVGGRLSDEQRTTIRLACGEHPLVVIEGHAGTGKSTTLTGITRAHQACGRKIVVTSTAALAAERLAGELAERGVECVAYSTAALHAATNSGRVELTSLTTVVHDEAALASTREQIRLLRAVEDSGARLVAVGDPRQNQPVGAGGLWTEIETATHDAGAHVELTANQRARDPEDRRDQARFRDGQAALAVRGYAARDRVHLDPEQRRIEDQALDAAHHDRTDGKTTIVIAQTSNEHLDELNARAQAIRRQHRQLGQESLDLPGRPYQLHAGDQVQVRHTIHHPDHGQLRNGTGALVADVDPRNGALGLRLADGTEIRLDDQQLADADLRLAYVQHPFPAQGHTTDTAHLIIATNPSREGTYVALTRARDETHLYAADTTDRPPETDQLQELADRISRTEPELPSIHSPLVHEAQITAVTAQAAIDRDPDQIRAEIPIQEIETPPVPLKSLDGRGNPAGIAIEGSETTTRDRDQLSFEPLEAARSIAAEPDPANSHGETNEAPGLSRRRWPRRAAHELADPQRTVDQAERDHTISWQR